uniref:Uncharacterized protein n=1 Tax=Oryza punctata TaxID=4537 RepID=A0A0E0LHA9_ORYPU
MGNPAARAGINPMKPPFVDSIDGAKRTFSSSGIKRKCSIRSQRPMALHMFTKKAEKLLVF